MNKHTLSQDADWHEAHPNRWLSLLWTRKRRNAQKTMAAGASKVLLPANSVFLPPFLRVPCRWRLERVIFPRVLRIYSGSVAGDSMGYSSKFACFCDLYASQSWCAESTGAGGLSRKIHFPGVAHFYVWWAYVQMEISFLFTWSPEAPLLSPCCSLGRGYGLLWWR